MEATPRSVDGGCHRLQKELDFAKEKTCEVVRTCQAPDPQTKGLQRLEKQLTISAKHLGEDGVASNHNSKAVKEAHCGQGAAGPSLGTGRAGWRWRSCSAGTRASTAAGPWTRQLLAPLVLLPTDREPTKSPRVVNPFSDNGSGQEAYLRRFLLPKACPVSTDRRLGGYHVLKSLRGEEPSQ